jgi:HEAT repeat protein
MAVAASRLHRSLWFLTLALALAAGAPAVVADAAPMPTADEIDEILRAAKRGTKSVEEQATALARLAWPSERPVNHHVAHGARKQLAGYGEYGLEALRNAIPAVDPIYRADVVATLLEAGRRIATGQPPNLLPAFEEALWYGSVEAQRLAMREIAQLRFDRGMLPIVDAVHEAPILLRSAVLSLGRLRDARSRFFLDSVLRAEETPLGDPRTRAAAADALAALLGDGTPLLRAATRSERLEVRRTSVAALVPVSGLEDLTVLHEYLANHPDDDPHVLRLVEKRVRLLESLIDQNQSGEDDVAQPEL